MSKDTALDPVITRSVLKRELAENNRVLIDEISGIFSDFAERVDERFNKVENRLDKIEFRLTGIESEIRELNGRVDNLENKYDYILKTLDAFLKQLSDKESNDAARDAQLARFDRWLHEIADKVNVKLEA